MHPISRLCAALLAIASAGLVPASPTDAQDWQLTAQYPRVTGYLGDRLADSTDFSSYEIYDPGTARFYSVFPLALVEGNAFIVDVYSAEFQPAITIQNMNYEIIIRGTIMDYVYDEPSNTFFYHARMEFHVPWSGDAELLVSSHDIAQGNYFMDWSLWHGSSGVTPIPEGQVTPGMTNCDCQDPATGRWFNNPIWVNDCDPAQAIEWCN
jgi:hypothetical protein